MSVLEMNQEQVELYATLGLAITQWAHVEQSLLKVYWHAMGEPDNDSAAACFYTIMNFNSKVAITDAALQVKHGGNEATISRWKNIQNKLLKRAKRRNELAHFQTFWDMADGKLTGAIIPHMANPLVWAGNQPISIQNGHKVRDIEAFRLKFAECFVDLENFFCFLRGQPEIFVKPQA